METFGNVLKLFVLILEWPIKIIAFSFLSFIPFNLFFPKKILITKNQYQVLGLVFNILGTILLAFSIYTIPTGMNFGWQGKRFNATSTYTIWALFNSGIIYLILGFLYQIVAALKKK